jgi:hypothetical protein
MAEKLKEAVSRFKGSKKKLHLQRGGEGVPSSGILRGIYISFLAIKTYHRHRMRMPPGRTYERIFRQSTKIIARATCSTVRIITRICNVIWGDDRKLGDRSPAAYTISASRSQANSRGVQEMEGSFGLGVIRDRDTQPHYIGSKSAPSPSFSTGIVENTTISPRTPRQRRDISRDVRRGNQPVEAHRRS